SPWASSPWTFSVSIPLRPMQCGHIACCVLEPTRSRAAPPRSSATSSPSACSRCHGCAERDGTVRFDLSDEQRAIREAVHDLCASRFDIAAAQRLADGSSADTLWPELAKSGWAGLGVSQAHGGQGLGVLELALVVEELGYVLAPAAFLGNAAAGLLIAAAGTEPQRESSLPGIASGERRGAFGVLDARGDAMVLDP